MRMTSSLQRWECPSSARVLAKLHIPSLDIAIQEVLTRQNWAERYSASRYTHRLQFHVSPNSGVFKIHGFWHSWKVPSSPNDPWTSRWVLGFFLNTRGFWLNGLRRKSILRNDTNNIFSVGTIYQKWFSPKAPSTRRPWLLGEIRGPIWRSKDHLVMKGLSKNDENHAN